MYLGSQILTYIMMINKEIYNLTPKEGDIDVVVLMVNANKAIHMITTPMYQVDTQ